VVAPDLQIARCMEMIHPEDVIRRIEMYYEGGALQSATQAEWAAFEKLIPTEITQESSDLPQSAN
jgi:hypothetical protein